MVSESSRIAAGMRMPTRAENRGITDESHSSHCTHVVSVGTRRPICQNEKRVLVQDKQRSVNLAEKMKSGQESQTLQVVNPTRLRSHPGLCESAQRLHLASRHRYARVGARQPCRRLSQILDRSVS